MDDARGQQKAWRPAFYSISDLIAGDQIISFRYFVLRPSTLQCSASQKGVRFRPEIDLY